MRSLRGQLQNATDVVVESESYSAGEEAATGAAGAATEAATGPEEVLEGGETGGVEESAAQLRADALSDMVEFLRSARVRDVALLKWVESSPPEQSNTTSSDIFARADAVKAAHEKALFTRRLYANRTGAGATGLEQLDDSALASVPEYGQALTEAPLSDAQCSQIYNLVQQCPGHFGCARKEGSCVSCSKHGPCTHHS